jgi:glycerol-3-phosphate O-acyltransferase
MKRIIKTVLKPFLLIFRKPITWLLLKNEKKMAGYAQHVKDYTLSAMVSQFNLLHKIFYTPFFRRVQYIQSDISEVKSLNGPIVFVVKNRGQLEYRYFNHLFLKEKIAPVHYAKGCLTVFWLPLKQIWRHLLCRLNRFYQDRQQGGFDEPNYLKNLCQKDQNVLVNLSISRDYLFGLIKTNPLEALSPLIDIGTEASKSIHIVTLQFLYDKHPDKTEQSYFDLLFGDKSQPGSIRKFLLFLMNYRRNPRVKFGKPINLKTFIEQYKETGREELSRKLFSHIEEDLRIEKARITGPTLHSQENLIKDIMADEHFQKHIDALAQKEGKKSGAVHKNLKRYFEEIGADVNYSYIHFVHITLRYLWNNVFDGLVVKHDQLNRVRNIAGKNPVVLVPMHRSHIDYLLISDLFYEYNITFPYVCAGINMNFWPVGSIIRRCGGFFIRRRMRDNLFYKEALYAYLKSLLGQGHCIEFFIEGTRSRTGKQLKPKMGILNMMMRAFFEGACDDIYFVPIAVNYDHILEEREYQKEGVGQDKKKENAGELLKVRRIFKKKYGKVYIEFAEPLSLKQYCAHENADVSAKENIKPLVESFAYHLTHEINRVAVVTPISLVSLAILSLNKKAFNFEDLTKTISVLKEHLDYHDAVLSDLINYSETYAYNEAIKKLCARGMIQEVSSFEENFYTFDDKHRPDFDYYKNNILHFYVYFTCLCKILNQIDNGAEISWKAIGKRFETLIQLFQHDFIFGNKESFEEDLDLAIKFAVHKEFIVFNEDTKTVRKTISNNNFDDFCIFHGLLDNFLESHLVILRYLKHQSVKGLDKKALIKDVLLKAKPMYLKDDLKHPESLSRFNLESSFQVLTDLGIMQTEQNDKQKIVYVATAEKDVILQWMTSIRDLLVVAPPISRMPEASREFVSST